MKLPILLLSVAIAAYMVACQSPTLTPGPPEPPPRAVCTAPDDWHAEFNRIADTTPPETRNQALLDWLRDNPRPQN